MIAAPYLLFALWPLAGYFLWMAIRGLRTTPRLMGGGVDTFLSATAISGLLVIGPIPWLLPDQAVQRFGVNIWLLVSALYILTVVLIVLLSRPRAIVSPVRLDTIKPLVAEIAIKLDPECTWAGDSVALPNRGLEFRLDEEPLQQTVVLQTMGRKVDLAVWNEFYRELRTSVRTLQVGTHPWTPIWTALAVVLACLPVYLSWEWLHTEHPDGWGEALTRALAGLLAL